MATLFSTPGYGQWFHTVMHTSSLAGPGSALVDSLERGREGQYRNLHGSSTADWTIICTCLALFVIIKSNEVVTLCVARLFQTQGTQGTADRFVCPNLFLYLFRAVCTWVFPR